MKNKYSYLLDKKIITVKDLIKAYYISQDTKKSTEAILIIYFDVKRKTLGKSLSLYYNCPFRAFDSNSPVPLAFLTGFDRCILINECWVPYSSTNDGIEVLVEDPNNFTKNEKIRGHLNTSQVKFSVAIKEDIEDFIHRLFREKENLIVDNSENYNFVVIPSIKSSNLKNRDLNLTGSENFYTSIQVNKYHIGIFNKKE